VFDERLTVRSEVSNLSIETGAQATTKAELIEAILFGMVWIFRGKYGTEVKIVQRNSPKHLASAVFSFSFSATCKRRCEGN